MPRSVTSAPLSLRDLLLRSDFGRRAPARVDELLRAATRDSSQPKASDRAVTA